MNNFISELSKSNPHLRWSGNNYLKQQSAFEIRNMYQKVPEAEVDNCLILKLENTTLLN